MALSILSDITGINRGAAGGGRGVSRTALFGMSFHDRWLSSCAKAIGASLRGEGVAGEDNK